MLRTVSSQVNRERGLEVCLRDNKVWNVVLAFNIRFHMTSHWQPGSYDIFRLSGQRTWRINKCVHVTLKENDSATYLVEQELSALDELQGNPEPTNPEFSLTRS